MLLHGPGNAHATITLGSTPATVPGSTGATQAAALSASSSPTSLLDPYLFGTWTGVTEDNTTTVNLAPVQFTGRGPTETFHPDGTQTVDYGTGTDLTATVNGEPWLVRFSGNATGHWETRGGMLYSSDIVANGTQTAYENGVYNTSGPLTMNPGPSSYTCSGNTLRIYVSQGSLVLTRASH